jgi:hypothetical protein
MAGDFNATLTALQRLKRRLSDGASMAQINIKIGNGSEICLFCRKN